MSSPESAAPRSGGPRLKAWTDLGVTQELVERYDRPGPRYTSYPTAPHWHDGFGPDEYGVGLDGIGEDGRLSLYFHLPFCRERCHFCGCAVVISSQQEIRTRYVSTLIKEMDLLLEAHPKLRDFPVDQIHWGGGTPTHLEDADLNRLGQAIRDKFHISNDAEVSIEVDPRVTKIHQLQLLADLGFNRISMGVQDLEPVVQDAIGRHQPLEMTEAIIDEARRVGFDSVSVDLIYGLPYQTQETFRRTMEGVMTLDPDRVSLFSYAHVPWLRPSQKKMPEDGLPTGWPKFQLFLSSLEFFAEAGYSFIGLDHFAKPEDELALARKSDDLHRNFQGYSTRAGLSLVGLGVTSIGGTDRSFAQNDSKLATYMKSVEAGKLPTVKGLQLSAEDQLRKRVISDIMCHSRLDMSAVARDYNLNFHEHFASEMAELEPFVSDGLVELSEDEIGLTQTGRLFVRNVAMVFDEYLRHPAEDGPRYSRTI